MATHGACTVPALKKLLKKLRNHYFGPQMNADEH
jgi:hypothetical protein